MINSLPDKPDNFLEKRYGDWIDEHSNLKIA